MRAEHSHGKAGQFTQLGLNACFRLKFVARMAGFQSKN